MGNPDAASAVGRLLNQGARGVDRDHVTAYRYFTQAAAAGDVDAMAQLGHMWANGVGVVRPSNETAVALFREAAEKGSARAAYGLGYMYLSGYGIERDIGKALELFASAAERGSPEAQFFLGALYARGIPAVLPGDAGASLASDAPPKRDSAKAFYNFNLAAAQGHATATYNLAVMQLSGAVGSPRGCESSVLSLKGLAERGPWTRRAEEAREDVVSGKPERARAG
jgi:TPR repeat protein